MNVTNVVTCYVNTCNIGWDRADDSHLEERATENFKKCPPPWLGDEENFEIYKF